MQWISAFVLPPLICWLHTASAAYLSNVAVELLAPTAGQETYLWIGFQTSNATSLYSEDFSSFPYHSLLIQEEPLTEQLLAFGNCSWLVELAGGWPGSVACDGGLLQFDGVLSAATWYELVMLVSISSSAIGTVGTRLRLLVGRQAVVPVPSENFQNQVEFFESSFGAVETGPANGFHWPGPSLSSVEDSIFDIISPRTFLPPRISFVVRMSLQIPSVLTAPMTFLVMARPFTTWSLQPGTSVVAPGEENNAASCMTAITWSGLVPVFRCFWVSFGQSPFGAKANGIKLIFDELPPSQSLTLQFPAQSPSQGSYEDWLVIILEGDGLAISNMSQTMPARALSHSAHGILVQASPSTEVLSYTSSAISTLNTLRLQVIPGMTIHGLDYSRVDATDSMGYARLYLPTAMGQLFACVLEPLEVWSSGNFVADLDSEQKTCTISVTSPGHFFAETSYVIRLSFYNAPIPFRSDQHTWSLELRAPDSAALSFPIPSPFDVVSAFTLFQVQMTRLAVSQSQSLDQLGLVRIDFQLAGESERLGSDDPVLCMHVKPASGFFLGGPECQNFQIHDGVPPASTCEVFQNGASMRLSLSSRLVPGLHMAFSVSMWNPNASLLLQGRDVVPWTVESRYGSCVAAGRLHAQRVGQSCAFGDWPQALYPLSLEISRISASTLTLGSEARVTLHFILPVPVHSGSRLVVSAPYQWAGSAGSVDTSATVTGASESWTIQQTGDKAEHPTELLMVVGSVLQSLVTYGFAATLIHPSTDLDTTEDPQWWSLEAFGVDPATGYRQDPTNLLPFESRFAAGTAAGYSLRRLRNCEVIPWKNEIGGTSPILLRFSVTIAMERLVAIPVLVVSPPLAFSFTRPCTIVAPRPSSAELSRKPLEGACRNNPTNTQVWVELSQSIAAFVPYVLELWSVQMPNQLSVIGNVWTLHLQRKIDSTDQTVEHDQEVAQCEGVQGFGLAWPLLKAWVDFRYSSFRPSAVSQVTFLFGTPEATVGDFSITIHGPVGASFPLDCSSALVDIVVSLASAALPGQLLSCVGGGGDADRAFAQLSMQEGFGGLVAGQVYATTLQVRNRPYISGLSKHSNSWRLSISDALWYVSEAISAGIPSYEMTEPPVIDFRVSSQRSTDRYSLAGPQRANVTLRFTVPEAQPSGTHLLIYVPPDSFTFLSPCRISRPDQLDWIPDERASQTEQVFTGSCKPSCVLLATPQSCDVETPTFARVVIALELEATISYCFAIETLSPEQSGLGMWTLEFRSPDGTLLESTGPVSGPQAGAMGLPTVGGDQFVVLPSTKSRAAAVVTLSIAFSLPLPLEGSVTIIPPAIAGQLAYHATAGTEDVAMDSVPLAKDMDLGRIGVPFFDFAHCCMGFQNTTPLPSPWSCLNSFRAMALSSSTSWKAFQRYGFILREVPGGAITGAMRLHQDSILPSFTLLAIASMPAFTALGAERSSVLAMGKAAGWPLATELRVQDLSMEQPLLEARGFSKLYLVVRLLTALNGQEARLVVRPPQWFRISWDSTTSTRLQPVGAGLGSDCQPNGPEGSPACYALQCYVSVLKTGQSIAMPHCSTPAGCCYGLGTAGAATYVQLLPSSTATPLLPGTRLEVTFLEVTTSSSYGDASGTGSTSAATDWTLATEILRGNQYEVVDEAQQDSPELYEGVRRAVVEPTYSFLSYDRELVVVLFELESSLPRLAAALLTFLAPPGFVFQSGPLDWSTAAARLTYMRAWSKSGLPESQALQGNGNIAAKALPEGVRVNLHGPRLDIEIPAELGGGSLLEALVPYSFPAYVDCPDLLQGRDQSFWLFRTYTRLAENITRPVHWGRLPGFVLRGSIPHLQIRPTALLPLFPRNVLRLTFMLSQDLPRAAPPPPGVAPCLRDCASRVLVIPPLGYVFPDNCEAIEEARANLDIFESASTLPPPFECRGVTLGAYSNASLILLEAEESSRTGMLLKDQEYQVWLLVRNPLFNPGSTENTWRVITRWADTSSSSVTLHEAELPGFSLTGMEGKLVPESVNPGVFHMLNITLVPRNAEDSIHGSDAPLRLQALLLVAPRGAELTCAGFLPGSLGGGSGPGGWDGSPERFTCMTQENLPSAGPCGNSGVPVPPGLWSLCLAAPRRPAWGVSSGSLETPPCVGDVASCTVHAPLALGNGTQAFAGQPLWFGVFVTNPQYMPFDNTWLLAVLGDQAVTDSGTKLLDVAGMDGYQLLKAG